MTDEQFEQYIREGIKALPLWVQQKLDNVAFLVADRPSKKQIEENDLEDEALLFGLYEGTPLTLRGDESILLPDTITLFKNVVFEIYDTEKDIRECIRNTVWHEVAHYLGRDEEWVEAEEIRRGKTL